MIAEWSRIYLEIILDLETSSKVNFRSRNWIFQFFEIFNFQFSSITHFLSHRFHDPSCRICSYGPHGPFWCSAKHHLDIEQLGKKNIWETTLFEVPVKMNLLSGGMSEIPRHVDLAEIKAPAGAS